jgi:hypothetical protein
MSFHVEQIVFDRPTKMLFHVERNAFERERCSNARLVRTAIEHSNGAALFSSQNKKGGLFGRPFKLKLFFLGPVDR